MSKKVNVFQEWAKRRGLREAPKQTLAFGQWFSRLAELFWPKTQPSPQSRTIFSIFMVSVFQLRLSRQDWRPMTESHRGQSWKVSIKIVFSSKSVRPCFLFSWMFFKSASTDKLFTDWNLTCFHTVLGLLTVAAVFKIWITYLVW